MARSRVRRWPTWMMVAGGRVAPVSGREAARSPIRYGRAAARPVEDDTSAGSADAGEEVGDELDGVLGGGEADALRGRGEAGEDGAGGEAVFAADEGVEAFEREGEVGAALVVGDGVDLVDDDGADAGEVLAGLAGGEQDVEGLGRGDEDVGRMLEHRRAVFGERVAGADAGADLGDRGSRVRGRVAGSRRAGRRGSSGRRWRGP